MNSKINKIGVFDSGLGGLTVLGELIKQLPHFDYVYYGDSANAPYGEKTQSEIINLSQIATRHLLSKGCQAIVIACNTATSAAAGVLRAEYPDISFFGMEPALKPAATNGDSGQILVMATSYTLSNEAYLRLRQEFAGSRKIIQLPAPKFVQLIESGVYDGPAVHEYFRELTGNIDLDKVDAIILGCTHFLFLKPALQEFLAGRNIKIYDGNSGTVRHVKKTLGIGSGDGHLEILSSAGQSAIDLSWRMLKNYQRLL